MVQSLDWFRFFFHGSDFFYLRFPSDFFRSDFWSLFRFFILSRFLSLRFFVVSDFLQIFNSTQILFSRFWSHNSDFFKHSDFSFRFFCSLRFLFQIFPTLQIFLYHSDFSSDFLPLRFFLQIFLLPDHMKPFLRANTPFSLRRMLRKRGTTSAVTTKNSEWIASYMVFHNNFV